MVLDLAKMAERILAPKVDLPPRVEWHGPYLPAARAELLRDVETPDPIAAMLELATERGATVEGFLPTDGAWLVLCRRNRRGLPFPERPYCTWHFNSARPEGGFYRGTYDLTLQQGLERLGVMEKASELVRDVQGDYEVDGE